MVAKQMVEGNLRESFFHVLIVIKSYCWCQTELTGHKGGAGGM